jgi:hypothetical protein
MSQSPSRGRPGRVEARVVPGVMPDVVVESLLRNVPEGRPDRSLARSAWESVHPKRPSPLGQYELLCLRARERVANSASKPETSVQNAILQPSPPYLASIREMKLVTSSVGLAARLSCRLQTARDSTYEPRIASLFFHRNRGLIASLDLLRRS